jgi:hypothetical protein
MNQYDIAQQDFYQYVIAAMTPRYKTNGVIDYVYINKSMRGNSTYGVPFAKWMSGRYCMLPATKHSLQSIKMMEHLTSYDRPITPLSYNSRIISSVGKPKKNMFEHNLIFGYRMKERKDPYHLQVCDAIERLGNTYNIFGNIIDHDKCYWVEWVLERERDSQQTNNRALPNLFLL